MDPDYRAKSTVRRRPGRSTRLLTAAGRRGIDNNLRVTSPKSAGRIIATNRALVLATGVSNNIGQRSPRNVAVGHQARRADSFPTELTEIQCAVSQTERMEDCLSRTSASRSILSSLRASPQNGRTTTLIGSLRQGRCLGNVTFRNAGGLSAVLSTWTFCYGLLTDY